MSIFDRVQDFVWGDNPPAKTRLELFVRDQLEPRNLEDTMRRSHISHVLAITCIGEGLRTIDAMRRCSELRPFVGALNTDVALFETTVCVYQTALHHLIERKIDAGQSALSFSTSQIGGLFEGLAGFRVDSGLPAAPGISVLGMVFMMRAPFLYMVAADSGRRLASVLLASRGQTSPISASTLEAAALKSLLPSPQPDPLERTHYLRIAQDFVDSQQSFYRKIAGYASVRD